MKLDDLLEQSKVTLNNLKKYSENESKRGERYYNAQLQKLVKAMEKSVNKEVIPLLRSLQPEYIGASTALTGDAWFDSIYSVIDRLKEQFNVLVGSMGIVTAEQFTKLVDGKNKRDFHRAMKRVGVDLTGQIERDVITDKVRLFAETNARLIQGFPDSFYDRVAATIMDRASQGVRASEIAKEIMKDYGVSERRAKNIARDQSLKFHSSVTKLRMESAGVTKFRWVTANDSRVSGNPAGLYPKAKTKCWEISKKNGGIYTMKDGASWNGETRLFPGHAHVNCRCVYEPIIEGVND